jgi:cell division initiation protein
MRITPLDARKQEFNKAMRGYDCAEVEAFLNTLADEYEAVLVDNKQIRERVMEQEDKLTEYQSMERNLRDTLMTAERVMKETRDNASKEGDLLIKDAEMKARGILEECRLRTEELRREIVGLRKEKETYLARFKSLAEAQIQFVETHKSDFDDLDRRLVDIVDTVVAGASKAETRPSPQASAPRTVTPPVAPATSVEPVDGPDPFVAPREETPEAAPVAPETPAGSGDDIWRDYTPGGQPSAQDPAATETSAAEPNEEAVEIADLVSESLAETDESADKKPQGDGVEAPTPTVDLGEGTVMTAGDQPNENAAQTAEDESKEETPASIW